MAHIFSEIIAESFFTHLCYIILQECANFPAIALHWLSLHPMHVGQRSVKYPTGLVAQLSNNFPGLFSVTKKQFHSEGQNINLFAE